MYNSGYGERILFSAGNVSDKKNRLKWGTVKERWPRQADINILNSYYNEKLF
jgi:hypothetical protein